MVCKNGGNCFTGTGHDEGYLDEFMLVDDGIEVNRRFLTQKFGFIVDNDYNIWFRAV